MNGEVWYEAVQNVLGRGYIIGGVWCTMKEWTPWFQKWLRISSWWQQSINLCLGTFWAQGPFHNAHTHQAGPEYDHIRSDGLTSGNSGDSGSTEAPGLARQWWQDCEQRTKREMLPRRNGMRQEPEQQQEEGCRPWTSRAPLSHTGARENCHHPASTQNRKQSIKQMST